MCSVPVPWCELKHSLCVILVNGLLDLTWNGNVDVHQRWELESEICLWKVVQIVLMILKSTRWRRGECCTLTAFLSDSCFLILYWWDKCKQLCSYNIRRGLLELPSSRPTFFLCLVLPWAMHENQFVGWRALAMGEKKGMTTEDLSLDSRISHRLFFCLCSHTMRRRV